MYQLIGCLVILLIAGQGCEDGASPAIRTVLAQVTPVEKMTKSDCFSCHFIEDRSVGPSYLKIAARYQTRDVEVRKLRTKIQEGGGGLWGSTQMSRHPFLEDADVDAMVEWVLSLADRETALQAGYESDASTAWEQAGEGVSVRLYLDPLGQYPADSTKLFVQDPHLAGTMPAFWIEGKNSPDVLPAVVVAAGMLHIKTAGKYFFRLRGKKTGCLYIGDSQVISILDGDRENLVALTAGEHSIRIEARLTRPAERVVLEWLPPGALYYRQVPAEQLSGL